MNRNMVVVGAQWGDEGKGKIVDYLSLDASVVARYQGGNNAGHTVYRGQKKFVMHLVPSGILEPRVTCVIGNGVVVDPAEFIKEIEMLEAGGIKTRGRLWVSEQCHLIFPYHRIYDRLREEKKGFIKIGTTGRGIGPCYSDRALRSGIRLGDLYDPVLFPQRLKLSLQEKNEIFRRLYKFKGFDYAQILKEYRGYAERLKPYCADTSLVLDKAIRAKKKVLFEGAQGTLLDIDQGTYPFVTSSSTISGGACVGAGVSPHAIHEIMGVAKAYTTRVGEGPFPTEFDDDLMTRMRTLGNEFGATTGRARRCGWFDACIVRYAARLNGLTQITLTKLDILDTLPKLKIAVAYRYKGKTFADFPHSVEIQRGMKPVYEEMPGWQSPTGHIRRYSALPLNARRYIERIAKLVGVPIRMVSVGKERGQVISCKVG